MLHELARQVKGEIARDVAQELAMARDLADELADRCGRAWANKVHPVDDGQAPSDTGRKGAAGRGDSANLTDAERLDRLEEAAKTLEQWLKDASLRAEGKSAEQIRELLEKGDATQIVEHIERIGELYLGGQKPEAEREAGELSRILEVLARQLDVLHRGIVAPELAALVEFDTRITELTAKLHDLRTDADISEWHRLAATLIRDLEKAGADRRGRCAGRRARGRASGTMIGRLALAYRRPRPSGRARVLHDAPDVAHDLPPRQDAGPDFERHGVGSRRVNAASVQRAGRALLRGTLDGQRQQVKWINCRRTVLRNRSIGLTGEDS